MIGLVLVLKINTVTKNQIQKLFVNVLVNFSFEFSRKIFFLHLTWNQELFKKGEKSLPTSP